MGNLLKYELLGNFRKSFPIIFAGIISNLLLVIFNKENVFAYYPLSILIWVAVGVIIFVDIFNSFKNELYSSNGYLTFTLPVSSKMILLTKLIAALLVSTIGAVFLVIFVLNGSLGKDIISYLKETGLNTTLIIFSSLIDNLGTILLIYFIICITKISAINGKMGGFVGVILFLITNIGINYVQLLIEGISKFNVNIVNSFASSEAYGQLNMSVSGNGTINLGVLAFNIILLVALFLGNSYLLDNEVNI